MMMPQVEVPGGASSLKRAIPPTKSCRATSTLVGNAFQAAGQAGAALHIMAVKIWAPGGKEAQGSFQLQVSRPAMLKSLPPSPDLAQLLWGK